MPEMIYVDSSNIEAVGYDPETLELHVQFRNGRTYVYYSVEDWTYQELLNAESKGTFLNTRIKPNYQFGQL